MDSHDIEYLRRRIADEHALADRATSLISALTHREMARVYEAKLEMAAAELVQRSVMEECSSRDQRMETALRHMG